MKNELELEVTKPQLKFTHHVLFYTIKPGNRRIPPSPTYVSQCGVATRTIRTTALHSTYPSTPHSITIATPTPLMPGTCCKPPGPESVDVNAFKFDSQYHIRDTLVPAVQILSLTVLEQRRAATDIQTVTDRCWCIHRLLEIFTTTVNLVSLRCSWVSWSVTQCAFRNGSRPQPTTQGMYHIRGSAHWAREKGAM
ncbi:hypothetical protein CBL_04018 [Carabus blaptoides fortunei]